MTVAELTDLFTSQEIYRTLADDYGRMLTMEMASLSGSSYSLLVAALSAGKGGLHIVVAEDKDSAAYLCNDLYALVGNRQVLFFPTGYKRSIQYGQEDPSGIVQRTAALNAIKNRGEGWLVICTYPEVLIEKVTDMDRLRRSTVSVSAGEKLSPSFLVETLGEYGFERVDFVHEPGQYSIRGGIVDVFSFSDNKPYRIDFFGDEVDSIRSFDIASQLSVEKMSYVEIVPNLKRDDVPGGKVSFAGFAGEATYWLSDPDHMFKRFDDIRRKILKELDDPSQIDNMVTGGRTFASEIAGCRVIMRKASSKERMPDRQYDFAITPQPAFNKKFELLAEDIAANTLRGYITYILSENKAQIERLQNIFSSIGRGDVRFSPMSLTLHEGFVSHGMRICVYTDHQIFDRYHRYRLDKEVDRSESLTIAELNALKVGDYVVHIDHGVGRFSGLVKTTENGRVHEAIKLVYRDNDVLLVNVHALHRISRYKDRDSDPPKIYKLGSGAWQKLKNATKKAVKDIARELIALYARRKASKGFAFSPDSYLQQELEASFIYDETPDQQKAIEAVKADMESPQPMDRLVCGDVGFGKTEVAIRAAFKAVSDSKQVAVLVPTTILSLQHYRTFNERLRDFPVRVEHLSRVKSTKEVKQILADLESGKIDILVGTQKILGKDVRFRDLGLLVIDEEQKFGVSSKEKLRQMSVDVDTLTLTATPIPRTLQFSLMGSRDLSVITTPPPNRQPITTESHLFDEDIIREAINFELARHGQVYFVHNKVQDIERIEALVQELCPGVRTVVGHGQMNPQELEKRVMDFIYGEYDVLIATTIIENGVDIPNANTIIINNAQNFGLSDLHQLRGRVGRSNKKAYCYLLTPPDEMLSSDSRRRLRAIEEFSDLGSGFNIAMQDLDIRGAGNLLGAEQSGFVADIGFETYQKILDEAMDELRDEGLVTAAEQTDEGEAAERVYLRDAYIETDTEAYIPDSYVSQSTEKIKLYRQLDSVSDPAQLDRFAREMEDRFGPLPRQVKELFGIITLRGTMIKLGFERAKIKNGLMILRFLSDAQSPYYQQDLFLSILRYVTERPKNFVLRQNNNKLSLTVRDIKGVGDACRTLASMYETVGKADGSGAEN